MFHASIIKSFIHFLLPAGISRNTAAGQSVSAPARRRWALKENDYEMRNTNSTKAEYYRTPDQEYVVQCQVMERKAPLINLEITVPTEEMAKTFCSHWSKKSQEIYAFLMETLS